jgi:hypothetical protein
MSSMEGCTGQGKAGSSSCSAREAWLWHSGGGTGSCCMAQGNRGKGPSAGEMSSKRACGSQNEEFTYLSHDMCLQITLILPAQLSVRSYGRLEQAALVSTLSLLRHLSSLT